MRRLTNLLLIICALCFSTTVAFAVDDSAHPIPWANFIYRVITIVAFVAIIAYFAGGKIKAFFKGRTEGISTELASLEKRKVEAQKNLTEVEKSIANLKAEKEAILTEYKAQGEAAKKAIIAAAEKSAEQLKAQAKITAENEVRHAIDTMRAEMAEHIVEATEKMLSQKLSADEQSKLINKYLTKVVLN